MCTPLHMLNVVFSRCDELVDEYGLEEIKTIGDAYMVASGVPRSVPRQLGRMADFALALSNVVDDLDLDAGASLQIRNGFNTGLTARPTSRPSAASGTRTES